MVIDGKTRVVVHLSYPSAHLKTPPLFNAACQAQGTNAVLVPWQVHPDHLAQVVAALRLSDSVAGMIVTIPHKETMAALCDRLEGPARDLSVANVVRKEVDGSLTGQMLDGVGFVQGLAGAGHPVAGQRVLMAGAGGVAIAIADAVLAAGATGLTVTNRTTERAERLAARLASRYPGREIRTGAPDATGFGLVINATALGMHEGDALPLRPATIAPGTVVAEVIMAPAVTPLLAEAAQRGAIPHEGRHMLTGQIGPFIDFVLKGVPQ